MFILHLTLLLDFEETRKKNYIEQYKKKYTFNREKNINDNKKMKIYCWQY